MVSLAPERSGIESLPITRTYKPGEVQNQKGRNRKTHCYQKPKPHFEPFNMNSKHRHSQEEADLPRILKWRAGLKEPEHDAKSKKAASQ